MTVEIEKKSDAAGPPKVNVAAYNSLVAAARLRDIKLLKSEFALDSQGLGSEENWKLSQVCEIEHAHFDTEDKMLFAFIGASAICKIKNKRVVTFRCRYLIVYDVQGDPAEIEVNAFANRVARFSAYPYFRAHVAEICSQAGLRLPPLPVLKEIKVIPKVAEAQPQTVLQDAGKEIK